MDKRLEQFLQTVDEYKDKKAKKKGERCGFPKCKNLGIIEVTLGEKDKREACKKHLLLVMDNLLNDKES